MYFEVIDLQTGKCADTTELFEEEWAFGIGGYEEGVFMIDQEFSLCLADEFGNYAQCPHGRFKIVICVNDSEHSFVY